MGGRPSQSLALGQTPPAPPFQGQHVPPTLGVSRPLPRCSAAPAQAALCLLGRARVPHCEWLSCLPRAPGPLDHHCHTGPTPRPCLGPTADAPETCSRCPFASHWLLSMAEELTPGGGTQPPAWDFLLVPAPRLSQRCHRGCFLLKPWRVTSLLRIFRGTWSPQGKAQLSSAMWEPWTPRPGSQGLATGLGARRCSAQVLPACAPPTSLSTVGFSEPACGRQGVSHVIHVCARTHLSSCTSTPCSHSPPTLD